MARPYELYWMLDAERRPRSTRDMMEWARWYENAEARRVAETTTTLFWISTVFLCIDHNWFGHGPPTLFETMVFDREPEWHPPLVRAYVREELVGECWRYASWDDAETGHAAVVRRIERKEAEALAQAKQEKAKP